MANVRIKDITTTASAPAADDYLAIDGATAGTRKISAANLGGDTLTPDIKDALLQIASKVAYIDDQGQDYYDDLYDALYPPAPPATLVSITAIYTQSGTVYDTDSLDSLKTDLVVTAHYDNSDTWTVPAVDYTLNGTLTAGTSTVTVTYSEKTTTFTVTVTASPQYVSDGLVHHWDAINNTGSGHNSSATTWKDLVGSLDLTQVVGGTWTNNALEFNPADNYSLQNWTSSAAITQSNNMTIEVCMKPTVSQTVQDWSDGKGGIVAFFTGYSSSKNRAIGMSKTDMSVGGFMNETNGFATTGFSSITQINSIVVTYTNQTASSGIFVNGIAKTKNANHTFGANAASKVYLGGYGTLGSDTRYPYLGKIHAIRIYNKVLTATEIADNYAIDVARFGLE